MRAEDLCPLTISLFVSPCQSRPGVGSSHVLDVGRAGTGPGDNR